MVPFLFVRAAAITRCSRGAISLSKKRYRVLLGIASSTGGNSTPRSRNVTVTASVTPTRSIWTSLTSSTGVHVCGDRRTTDLWRDLIVLCWMSSSARLFSPISLARERGPASRPSKPYKKIWTSGWNTTKLGSCTKTMATCSRRNAWPDVLQTP